jgi:hypothetical protein
MKWGLISTLFFSSFCFAQSGGRDALNPDQLEVKEFKLEVERTVPSEIKLPFKSIKIIDSRFDTSKIGYLPFTNFISGKKKLYKKMVLMGGISNAIESYYNEYYTGSFTHNDFELLIVMKRFWISGNAIDNPKRIEVVNSVKMNSNIYCKWEYYLGKNGKYLPIKRIDTVIRYTEDLAKYGEEEFRKKKLSFFKYTLKTLIEILDYSNAVKQFNDQPKKTLTEIKEFNAKMYVIPILQDSGFKKGVYLSFDDFKNNRPSIMDFREKKMGYSTINTENYLETMNGEEISNYWGYSDGKDFRYGMLVNDKIYRIQNTFCFFIKAVGYFNSQDIDLSTIITSNKLKYESWIPFQIDMETGEIY